MPGCSSETLSDIEAEELAKQVTFCITAMPRPDVFETTIESFNHNLRGTALSMHRLLLNIDPFVGRSKCPAAERNSARLEVLRIAQQYFGDVVVRLPAEPDFGAAVKWLWQTATSSFVFHLEDDWQLFRPVSLQEMFREYRSHRFNPCVQVRLNVEDHYGDGRPDKPKVGLSPGLFPIALYGAVGRKLIAGQNPEYQLFRVVRDPDSTFRTSGAVVALMPASAAVVRDIGRDWLAERGEYRKPIGEKKDFVCWEAASE